MHTSHTRGGHQAIPGFFLLVILLVAACSTPPPASVPLTPSYDSKEAAATAFLQALVARDRDTLATQVVSESEFLKHIWPALPASAPQVGMSSDRAWADQAQRNALFLSRTFGEHGGRRYELVAVRFDGPPTTYDSFTIHPKTTLDVRDGNGVQDLELFGSMIESGGRWKIYSYVVD